MLSRNLLGAIRVLLNRKFVVNSELLQTCDTIRTSLSFCYFSHSGSARLAMQSSTITTSLNNKSKTLSEYNLKPGSIIPLTVPKRVPKKHRISPELTTIQTNVDVLTTTENYRVIAYATADYYNLDDLKEKLLSLSSIYQFQLAPISDDIEDVLCLQNRLTDNESTLVTNNSSREAFIFDDGCIVYWNMTNDERKQIMNLVNEISENIYPESLIEDEKEEISFIEVTAPSALTKDLIRVTKHSSTENLLDKYAFSNALALSVKLGVWETLLDTNVEFIADLAEQLKRGQHPHIKAGLIQRKSGELYSLKHAVNLSHDFLDTPDFYWDNRRLEQLYLKTFNYLVISKRTKVLNERLNFSLEMISVIEGLQNEKKHVRLEWIIIILICCEVFFNVIDHLDFFGDSFIPKHKK
ncbi:unnamed protein product [Didymodactylos carnosus]|uniref:DUF155 domain-containing protein n=2 Tax=Didymodactylos carnosus TaxID=1234261 RepID=A0A814AG42_9BILA|nr:unnamed protein product [Didymodactylos carnosus]CAF3695181.1 unnamed protein product [Didymodactylos carnosus]